MAERVDYAEAWVDLLDLIVSKDGWGSKTLAAEAARIAAKHRIPETFLERALRVHGGSITLAAPHPPVEVSNESGSTLTGFAAHPDHRQSEEDTDEHVPAVRRP